MWQADSKLIPRVVAGEASEMKITTVSAFTIAGVMAAAAHADSISWVDWTDGGESEGEHLVNGTAADLTVAASFTARSSPTWGSGTGTIGDPNWGFDETSLPFWAVGGAGYSAVGTFDFTNEGGLQAGGSLAIVDLENRFGQVNTVGVKGYQWDGSAYQEVAVQWTYSYFYLQDPNAGTPTWDPATATLTGGEFLPSASSFAMLTSDRRLDRIVLDIDSSDPVGFAFTQSNVAAGANAPVPGVAALAPLAAAGLARRRRR